MKNFKFSFVFYLKSLKYKPHSFIISLAFIMISFVYFVEKRPNEAIEILYALFPFIVLAMSIDNIHSEINNDFNENILFLKIDREKYFLYKNFHPLIISSPILILAIITSFILKVPISYNILIYFFLALYYSFLGTLLSYITKGMSNFLIIIVGIVFYEAYIGFIIGFDKFHSMINLKKIVINSFLILTYPVFIKKELYFILFYLLSCIIIYYFQVRIWKKKK